jgi:hypothetical protein
VPLIKIIDVLRQIYADKEREEPMSKALLKRVGLTV